MKRLFILVILAASFIASAAQRPPLELSRCVAQVPFGISISKKQQVKQICRAGYLASFDVRAKIPALVSYVLSADHADGCLPRTSTFVKDQSLGSYSPSTKDYAKSGYDIGHLANSADMRWDELVEKESFILSNAAPQLGTLNRGDWKQLEDLTRAWAIDRKTDILIYVGTIYDVKQNQAIGSGVVVPSAFFKVLVDLKTHEAMAFIFQQSNNNAEIETYITSLAEVQRQSGFVFKLPKDVKFTGLWPVDSKNNLNAKKAVCLIK